MPVPAPNLRERQHPELPPAAGFIQQGQHPAEDGKHPLEADSAEWTFEFSGGYLVFPAGF